jgi:hypothetical protein
MYCGRGTPRRSIGIVQHEFQESLLCKKHQKISAAGLVNSRAEGDPKVAVSWTPGRRVVLGVILGLSLQQGAASALPRGSVDARVTNAFNTAFAQGGNFVVCYRCTCYEMYTVISR